MIGPWILGVSYSHNGAACLLHGDELVVAIQEERLSGIKRARIDHYQESLAVRYCLAHAGITLGDIDVLVACHFSVASPPAQSLVHATAAPPKRYLTIPHHLGHAHAAFATSGLPSAVVLIVDGQGGAIAHLPPHERTPLKRGVVPGLVQESEVISIYRASTTEMTLLEKHAGDWMPTYRQMTASKDTRSLQQFGSLGGMYSAVSALIFGDAMEAGKVMGLAPYGTPTFPVEAFLSIDDDGCFHYSDRLLAVHRDLAPWPANRDTFVDLAASTQAALEHALVYLARRARELGGSDRLCYAGGVALNSVANELLCTTLGFTDVHIMPAAEDSGAAIGAAFYGLRALGGTHRFGHRAGNDSVGRPYSSAEITATIARIPYLEVVPADDVLDQTVSLLCDGKIVGWFEGRSELGPRSLGQRSILCDARRPDGKAVLNDRVKHRESFRPFAPVILRHEIENWFDVAPGWGESPYMLRVCTFKPEKRDAVPAVVHVDGTGRVQTVTADANGRLFQLVERFGQRTGVPILLNTSFNLAGEPIIETPEDALFCMLGTGVDAVVLDGTIVRKTAAHRSLLQLYPRILARRVRLSHAIEGGNLDLSIRGDAEVSVELDTAHGPLTTRLRPSDLGILRVCDGVRDGYQIVDVLGRASTEAIEAYEAYVARRLYHLRRAHVIALREEPAA